MGRAVGHDSPQGDLPPRPTPMRTLIDLGDYVVGIDKADKTALSFFEEEGVGTVLHARSKADRRVVGRLWLQFDDLSMFSDEADEDMVDKTSAECFREVHALKKRHPKMRTDFVGRIRYVAVDDGHARKGIGGALYVAAAMVAFKEQKAAIVADACFPDGQTSSFAMRVWNGSRQLRNHCDVEGFAALLANA